MKKLLALLFLAALSVLALVWIFPRRDASRLWQLELNRDGVLARARGIAKSRGVNVDSWTAAVRSRSVGWALELADGGALDAVSRTQALLIFRILFRDPAVNHRLEIQLNAQGRLLGWKEDWENPPLATRRRAEAEIAAEAIRWFEELAGANAWRFRQINRGVRQGREEHYSWEWNDPAVSPHVARVEVVFAGDRFLSANFQVTESRALAESRQARQSLQIVAFAVVIVVIALVSFIANPIFFRALVRGRLRLRRLVTCFALFAGIWLVAASGGSWWDDRVFSAAEKFTSPWVDLVGNLIGWVLLFALITVMYGTGRVLIAEDDRLRWLAFEKVLRGNWWTRIVGEELTAGALGGTAIAAAAIALPALLFPGALLYSSSSDFAAFRLPTVWPLREFASFVSAGLWFAVWPLCRKWRWGPSAIGMGLFVLAGMLGVSMIHAVFESALLPILLGGLIMTGSSIAVYRNFGLLATLVAQLAMLAAIDASTAFNQPAAEWQASAWRIAGLGGALAGAGLLIAWRGRMIDVDAELAQLDAETVQQNTGDRDRLTAEFEVARRAQQGMLPSVPAQAGVFDLAASCQPAREVGGDLYDFFAMGDGRYGVCVADVSGKGVPASLYMSLTKGYLAAAGPEESDLRVTLADLNTHLHAAGKKRIFVTMAIGVLDIKERTLDLARAGHNAILWRRPRRSESRFVQPKGLGLGITTRLLFERNLEVTRLELEPGEVVVLYSDGVPEAMNIAREQYGEERLTAVVERCDGLTAEQIQAEILRDLHHFIGAAPPHDDITLFVLRWGENGNQ